jgi:hypothetical protein
MVLAGPGLETPRSNLASKKKAGIYSDSAALRCLFGIYISLGGHEWVELRVTEMNLEVLRSGRFFSEFVLRFAE